MLEVNTVFQFVLSAGTHFGCLDATIKRPLEKKGGDLGSGPSLLCVLRHTIHCSRPVSSSVK